MKPFRITIRRATEDQLNMAINDLVERGFKVIQQGIAKKEVVCYSTTNKKNAKYDFVGTTKYDRVWARLEKIQ